MSHAPSFDDIKRKREQEDRGTVRGHQRKRSHLSYPSASPSATPRGQLPAAISAQTLSAPPTINYLPQRTIERLALLPGDADTFSDLASLATQYEAVLERQESLAASLGAKLTGPLFLKRIEKFFDGPIKINSKSPYPAPINWLDVVAVAKANPNEFVLTTQPNGSKFCQFMCKGVQVEITEDDWRLISSGALDRFPLEQPFEEDETAELATLDILEQRATLLWRKAEEVAHAARVLHGKFGLRKHEITMRRSAHDTQPRFHSVNAPQRSSTGAAPYDIHADLLQQFTSNTALIGQSRSNSGLGASASSTAVPASPASHTHGLSGSSRSTGPLESSIVTSGENHTDIYRPLVTRKTEKLSRGDTIAPPCDRCRRLRLICVKHLTACQGCTKKHAKCSWKAITDDEIVRLRQEMGVPVEVEPSSANLDLEQMGSRRSLPPRIIEETGPIAFAAAEVDARQESRSEGASNVYSPDSVPPNVRFETEQVSRRQSAGYDYEASHTEQVTPTMPEQKRPSQTASTITTSSQETGGVFSGLLNPPT